MEKSDIIGLYAGIWYTVCNFIDKGIVYLCTPFFTRLLTKEQFGEFNNFTAWGSMLIVVTTLDLHNSIIRARLDFKNDFDGFVSSTVVAGVGFTLLLYAIVCNFPAFFSGLFGMSESYIHLMFIYLLLKPAFDFYQKQQRALVRYKLFSLVALSSSVATMLFSVLFVILFQDKLLGIVYGTVAPQLLIAPLLYGALLYKGRKIRAEYIKYALTMTLPLILHHLAWNVLSASGRVMIMRYSGAEDTALFSLAHTCAMVVSLLFFSINYAFTPWLFENIHAKKYDKIRKVSNAIILIFIFLVAGFLLLSPEILLIMGGAGYVSVIWVMPPVIAGCCFQAFYVFYVNIHHYRKKTMSIFIGTVLAASVNVLLNMTLIPLYGYMGAALNTLPSYLIPLFFNYLSVQRTEYKNLYDNRFIWITTLCVLSAVPFAYLLYYYTFIRYGILLIYCVTSLFMVIRRDALFKKLH